MSFDDNVALSFLLGRAVNAGELAVKLARNQLDFLPRANDYEDEIYQCPEPRFDQEFTTHRLMMDEINL